MSYSEALKVRNFYENNKGIVIENTEEYEKAKEIIDWYENSWK